jgi:hypothetical protein
MRCHSTAVGMGEINNTVNIILTAVYGSLKVLSFQATCQGLESNPLHGRVPVVAHA